MKHLVETYSRWSWSTESSSGLVSLLNKAYLITWHPWHPTSVTSPMLYDQFNPMLNMNYVATFTVMKTDALDYPLNYSS